MICAYINTPATAKLAIADENNHENKKYMPLDLSYYWIINKFDHCNEQCASITLYYEISSNIKYNWNHPTTRLVVLYFGKLKS